MIIKWDRLGLAYVAGYQCLEYDLSSLHAWMKLLNHGFFFPPLYTHTHTHTYMKILLHFKKKKFNNLIVDLNLDSSFGTTLEAYWATT